MKKWVISAVIYLLVVVAGYTVYAQFSDSDAGDDLHDSHSESAHDGGHEEEDDGHDHDDGSHEHGAEEWWASEVNVEVNVTGEKLQVLLKDADDNSVEDLEVSHEKLMHLIVVGADMETYKHLHPEKEEPGIFEVKHDLPEGEYKAFIDIKPKGMNYQVEPISFTIGEEHGGHEHSGLEESESLTLEQEGHKVTLNPSSLKAGEESILAFDLHGETPEQYLGAMGHVVILDEEAEEYLHVHPGKADEPVFMTEFKEPGLYKVWAEFQFEGEVFVFPYVLKITE